MPTLQVINVHRTLCGRTDTNSFKRFIVQDVLGFQNECAMCFIFALVEYFLT